MLGQFNNVLLQEYLMKSEDSMCMCWWKKSVWRIWWHLFIGEWGNRDRGFEIWLYFSFRFWWELDLTRHNGLSLFACLRWSCPIFILIHSVVVMFWLSSILVSTVSSQFERPDFTKTHSLVGLVLKIISRLPAGTFVVLQIG